MRGISQDTINLVKEALANGQNDLAKNISIATGLTAYDLQAPAKNLYPTITPIRPISSLRMSFCSKRMVAVALISSKPTAAASASKVIASSSPMVT